jgi:hypothetical protein
MRKRVHDTVCDVEPAVELGELVAEAEQALARSDEHEDRVGDRRSTASTTPERLAEVAKRHGIELIGPPGTLPS